MKPIHFFLLLSCIFSIQSYSQCIDLHSNNRDVCLYTEVDELPTFKSEGYSSALQYIYANIEYPKEADVTGTIIVSFVVTCLGYIRNVKIERGLYDECDIELIRVISSMPKWTPGRLKGKSVNTMLYLPIKIKLH